MVTDLNLEEKHFDSSSVEESLQQVLHSKEFKGALQLQALLKFIVENSISGHDDALKERIIGINVFDRKPDYETGEDPIVRSRVRQLRKRLERYYEGEEAQNSTVQIVIPKGSYKPAFVFRTEINDKGSKSYPFEDQVQAEIPRGTAEGNPNFGAVTSVPALTTPARWRGWKVVIALAGVLLLGLVASIGIAKQHKSRLDLFWKPIFDSKKKVIIYNGSTHVYLPSTIYNYNGLSLQPGDYDQPAMPAVEGALRPLVELTAKDLVLVPYRYVRSEGIETNLKIARLLDAHHLSMESRVEPDLPFVDLRGSPIVLLGAYNNYWTLELTQDLPYFFDRNGRVHERGGQQRTWSTPPAKDDRIIQDYAIIARLLDSKAGGPVIIIAGITTCGTQAAAEFVTDPVQLQKLDSFPKYALERKNLEFVLRTSLINCNPTSLDIMAQHDW